MSGKILRLVSMRAAMQNQDDFHLKEKLLRDDTLLDVASAERVFDEWFDNMNKTSSREASRAADNAIWGYIDATNQFYYENGIRWGTRLILEALSGKDVSKDIADLP